MNQKSGETKQIKVNLGKRATAVWDVVINLPEFRYTPQQGIIDIVFNHYMDTKHKEEPNGE